MRWACALVLCAGCNAAFDLAPTVLVDARPDGFVCSHGAPFGAGVRVPIDPAYSVEAARFNRERSLAYLSLCPASGAKTGCDLYTSPYTVETASFNQYTRLAGVSTPNLYDSYPTISADGQYLLFASERTPSTSAGVHIWTATAQASSFDQPAFAQTNLVPGGNHSNEPFLLGDGHTLYFSVEMNGVWDLYRAVGDPPAWGGTAELVPGLQEPTDEVAAVVSDDELEVFYSSNRKDPSLGYSLDIWTATRGSTSEPFGAPVMLDTLSTAGRNNDWPVWISPDHCQLFYINKLNGVATLYVATR